MDVEGQGDPGGEPIETMDFSVARRERWNL